MKTSEGMICVVVVAVSTGRVSKETFAGCMTHLGTNLTFDVDLKRLWTVCHSHDEAAAHG